MKNRKLEWIVRSLWAKWEFRYLRRWILHFDRVTLRTNNLMKGYQRLGNTCNHHFQGEIWFQRVTIHTAATWKKKNYLTPVSGVVLAQPVRWQAIECTPNVQSAQERNSPISTIQAFYWRTKSKSKAVTSLSWYRSGGIYTLRVPYDLYSSDMFFF